MGRAARITGAPVGAAAVLAALCCVGAVGAAGVVVLHPELLRALFALTIAGTLLALLLTRPQAGLVGVAGWLLVMGLTRRLLIEPAGWAAFDPLLLVSPLLAALMAGKLFLLDKRPLAPDTLSKWVLAVLLIAVLQVFNPLGGGILTGMGGLLFVGIPLLWFLVGRELASDALVEHLSLLTLGAAVAVGAYGLVQTQIGFPPWDQDWILINGYVSLNVGDTVRAFGTFASSAEYALVLGAGLAIAVAYAVRGRVTAVLALPLLAIALFLASGRSALILSVVAAIVVVALNTRKPVTAALVTAIALAGAVGGLAAFSGSLSSASQSSGDLASHQLGGLSDPLDPSSSTLLLHADLVGDGIKEGFVAPLGHGTGASNSAAGKLGGAQAKALPTEMDLSNAFVSFGLLGGIAYLGVVVLILRRVVRLAFAGRFAALPVAGVLVVAAGQWLIGGNYALCAILWLLVGWLAAAGGPPGNVAVAATVATGTAGTGVADADTVARVDASAQKVPA